MPYISPNHILLLCIKIIHSRKSKAGLYFILVVSKIMRHPSFYVTLINCLEVCLNLAQILQVIYEVIITLESRLWVSLLKIFWAWGIKMSMTFIKWCICSSLFNKVSSFQSMLLCHSGEAAYWFTVLISLLKTCTILHS